MYRVWIWLQLSLVHRVSFLSSFFWVFPFFITPCFLLSHLSFFLSSPSSSFSSWSLILYICCFLSFHCAMRPGSESKIDRFVFSYWMSDRCTFDKGGDNAAGLGVSDLTHVPPDWCTAVPLTTLCPLPSAPLPENSRSLISSPAVDERRAFVPVSLFPFLSVASSAPFRDKQHDKEPGWPD